MIFKIVIFDSSDIRKVIFRREVKMTQTMFFISFCYFVFVLPISAVNIFDSTSEKTSLYLGLFCLYWVQYSFNFFIYAARSEQYRKAYVYFLKKVCVFVLFIKVYLWHDETLIWFLSSTNFSDEGLLLLWKWLWTFRNHDNFSLCRQENDAHNFEELLWGSGNFLNCIHLSKQNKFWLKYCWFQIPQDATAPMWPPHLSSVAENHSNISLYGSAEPVGESAVIIVTR